MSNTDAVAAASPMPSAIGAETVFDIAVSPDYQRSGMVAVMSSPLSGCTGECMHLWVSHDGGSTWLRATAQGWKLGEPLIVVDQRGRDVLLTATGTLQRSDDGGQTWNTLGQGGFSTPSPTFARDATVAVAGAGSGPDVLWSRGATHSVSGSGGTLVDLGFMLPSDWPVVNSQAPVLLSAADPQSHVPVVERCTPDLTCANPVALPGATSSGAPAALIGSPHYTSDHTVFARTPVRIDKSVDGGAHFLPLSVGSAGATATATPMLALDANYGEGTSDRLAYVAVLQATVAGSHGTTGGGIYRSSDGGTTWAPLPDEHFTHGATAVAVAPDGRLFGGYLGAGHAGLLCSSDGGTHWQTSCSPVGAGSRTSGAPSPASTCVSGGCTSGGAQRAGPIGPPSDGQPGGSAASPSRQDAGATVTPRSGTPVSMVAIVLVVGVLAGSAVAAWIRNRRASGRDVT